MAALSWVHWASVVLAVALASCGAQIFPFSNLKHIFEQKGKAKLGLPTVAAPAAPAAATTPEPPPATTTALADGLGLGLAPYFGSASLFDEDGGYRQVSRPDKTSGKHGKARKASSKAGKPAKAWKPEQGDVNAWRPEQGDVNAWRPEKGDVSAWRPEKGDVSAWRPAQSDAKQHAAESIQAPYLTHAPQATHASPAKQKPPPWQSAAPPPRPSPRPRAAHAGRPSPHLVPLRIAYEPTTPAGNGNGIGDEHVVPPLYLTPPRAPATLVPADVSPSATSSLPASLTNLGVDAGVSAGADAVASSSQTTAAAASPLPPVPAVYLRPPGPPGPSGPPEPILFQPSVELHLADVAKEAAAQSTNPGIVGKAAAATSANHKLTSAPHPGNALLAGSAPPPQPPLPGGGRGLGPSKLQGEYTNHKAEAWPDKHGARGPDGHRVPGNHSPDADSDESFTLVDSSDPARAHSNHRPLRRPGPPPLAPPSQHLQQHQRAPKHKNHKASPAGPSLPARPVKYANHKPPTLDEQESMTSLRYRKRPLGPLEQAASATGLQHAGQHPGYAGLGDGDRVEFQMHGQQGPESYKFGYDTGNGHNRQFRYEERDHHGNVKGHYGFVDEHGKLQVVNYKADPHGGYKADVSKLHT